MFRQVFRNLSPDTVNLFLEMFTIAGVFFCFFLKLEIYEVYGDSPEEGLCHFWLQTKEQSRFFLGIPLYLATL
jgi:hypothetical protein